MKKTNLTNFGKKLKFSKRPAKKKVFSEKEMFIETVDLFLDTWRRSNNVYEQHKVNLLEYEEQFYQIVENLLFVKYGPWKTELILWYVFAREDAEGKVSPLIFQVENKQSFEVTVNNSDELWELLAKLEEDENLKSE